MDATLSPAAAQTPHLLLTARQTAAALALSERTIFTLTKAGELHPLRIGRALRYSVGDLRAWIESKKAMAR